MPFATKIETDFSATVMAPASPSLTKLLIVDDDPMMRLGLTAALSSQPDFTVAGEASDGRQGIEQAAALCPDVALMDVGMPGVDGIAAT
jgi:DNA-binding NarL/FixJ family response regulator